MTSPDMHIAVHKYTIGGMATVAFGWIVSSVVQNDAFLHGLASLMTVIAAAVSIYFAFKRKG